MSWWEIGALAGTVAFVIVAVTVIQALGLAACAGIAAGAIKESESAASSSSSPEEK